MVLSDRGRVFDATVALDPVLHRWSPLTDRPPSQVIRQMGLEIVAL
jgi:hypothetical protein